MKFYKDANGMFWLGGQTIPSGCCSLHVNGSTMSIVDMGTQNTVFSGAIADYQKENGTSYASLDELKTAMCGFFCKASQSGGVLTAFRFASASVNSPTTSTKVPFETLRFDSTNGIVTYNNASFLLKAGKTYKLQASIGQANYSNTSGVIRYGWRTGNTGGSGTWVGNLAGLAANAILSTSNYETIATAYYTPAVDTYVHLGISQALYINWISNTGEGASCAWAEILVM